MQRIFGLPKEERARAAAFLADQGFESVVVGADEDAESVRPALDAGLQVWGCRAAFTVRRLSETEAAPLLAQDVDGAPHVWFGSGCPNQSALRETHLAHVRRIAESGAFTGFMLDGIRFASPNAGDGFFSCFCQVCEAKSRRLGFDFERMRQDVRALRDWSRSGAPHLAADPTALLDPVTSRWPGVADWLRFREACVNEHVREVRAAVDEVSRRGARVLLGAYLFAPTFAPWVGQDYPSVAPLLDVVSPMLYRTLTPGDSCLTTEWGALAALNLIAPHGEFSPQDVAEQVRLARQKVSSASQLVPILQLDDDQVASVTAAARLASPDGLDYFSFRTGNEPYLRAVAQ